MSKSVSILPENITLNKTLINIIKTNSFPLEPLQTNIKPLLEWSGKIRCIIFDIYGTLLISASGDIGFLNGASLSTNFYKALEKSDIVIHHKDAGETGLKLFTNEIKKNHSIKRESGIDYPEVDIVEIWESVILYMEEKNLLGENIPKNKILSTAVWFECLTNPVWLMPYALNLLLRLKEKKIHLGIISNAQFYTPLIFPALTGYTLKSLGFNSKLTEYSYKTGIAKPSTDIFFSVISRLKKEFSINPDEILYVGNDMLNDVYSAKSAGINAALFAGDRRSLRLRKGDTAVKKIKPDLIITNLDQILELV